MFRKLYNRYRDSLPEKQQAKLSQLIFALSGKPFVKKDDIPIDKKFPNDEKGGIIISADFELAWAWRYAKMFDDPIKKALEMSTQARKNFPGLIRYFETYNVPITWATVGHLFLESCKKGDHDNMERIPYFENRNWRYDKGDWFEADPCTNVKDNKHWYAPDLIRMILDSKVDHEIGSHTFSHIDFTYENCPEQVAMDEIKACIDAAKPYNVGLKSIVFPGGTFGNIEVLKKFGINIYRKNVSVDLAYPYFDELGVLVTPTTSGFGHFHPTWSADYYVKRFKIYIDKAIRTGTIAHLWFHPSIDEFSLNDVIPRVLEYAAKKRDEGHLWIGTMDQISEHIIQNHKN